MYQHSFCELGLKLAVNRSEQKRDDKRQTTNQQPESSAISASSLTGLDFSWAGLVCSWSGLGWAGLGWAGLPRWLGWLSWLGWLRAGPAGWSPAASHHVRWYGRRCLDDCRVIAASANLYATSCLSAAAR